MSPNGNPFSRIGEAIANNPLQAATIAAGAIAGSHQTPGTTTTTQSKTDPRFDPYLYGQGGLLESAKSWFDANKTGINPTMQSGWDRQLGLLRDPNTAAQIAQMQQSSAGLLGTPVRGNGYGMKR